LLWNVRAEVISQRIVAVLQKREQRGVQEGKAALLPLENQAKTLSQI